MKYPGTISLTEETYRRLLTDICSSLAVHGFKHIVLIGDSGGNQDGMKDVAAQLNAKWQGKTRVHFIPEYYDYGGLTKWLEEQGIKQTPEGLHDDFAMTAMMMSVDPQSVRMQATDRRRQVPHQRRRPGAGREDDRLGKADHRSPRREHRQSHSRVDRSAVLALRALVGRHGFHEAVQDLHALPVVLVRRLGKLPQ